MSHRGWTFELAHLEALSDSYLLFAKQLGRPLTDTQKNADQWLLRAWEKAEIKKACRKLDKEQCRAITQRIEALRELFRPDPVRQPRVKRDLDGAACKDRKKDHCGIDDRGMTPAEALDRLTLLRRMVGQTHYLVRELELYYGGRHTTPGLGRDLKQFCLISKTLLTKIGPHPEAAETPNRRMAFEKGTVDGSADSSHHQPPAADDPPAGGGPGGEHPPMGLPGAGGLLE